jgi:ferric-dicitrate binding protein FerR (iron transport regulator)
MTYILSHGASRPALVRAALARLTAARTAFQIYRHKRAIYLRTLRELRSYKPHELHDLKIHSGDFEELARKQAGW